MAGGACPRRSTTARQPWHPRAPQPHQGATESRERGRRGSAGPAEHEERSGPAGAPGREAEPRRVGH
eukprot:1231101-Pyramimonas_sp.AAC.1